MVGSVPITTVASSSAHAPSGNSPWRARRPCTGPSRGVTLLGMELSGRVALVTGASRGLGFLLARELAAQGCRVAICARDPEELGRARAALEREGAQVLAVPCDVADRVQVERLVADTVARFGSLDVLVTNAGVIQAGPLGTMRVEDFEDALAVMFWGVVLPTLAALPHLRAGRGRIVTITSIGGKIASPHLLPYDCAKFAAVGFSEGIGAELAREGIRVTTVVPPGSCVPVRRATRTSRAAPSGSTPGSRSRTASRGSRSTPSARHAGSWRRHAGDVPSWSSPCRRWWRRGCTASCPGRRRGRSAL